MNLQTAAAKLYDTTFLLGRFRRKAALKTLAKSPEPGAIALLAEALVKNHPNASQILAGFSRLSPQEEPGKVVALWQAFGLSRRDDLAKVLAKLGWPEGQTVEAKLGRDILAAASAEASDAVIQAVVQFARALPVGDEARNDAIYAAWVRSQSKWLEKLIHEQHRQAGDLAYDALYALVTGDTRRYAELSDEDGALLTKAYALAPPAFRDRIRQTVTDSTDRRLKDAYRRAMTVSLTPEAKLANLKQVGDEDGLFEEARNLRLLDVLGLCERWAASAGRPSQPEQAAVVNRAVTAYQNLGKFRVEPGPALPEGLVDIFDHWRGQKPSEADLRDDLKAEDPFAQARGLYLGHERGWVDRNELTTAAASAHWPLRLVARLLNPALLAQAGNDHVLWVNACGGDAGLLQVPILGSPEDYARHSQQLKQARGPAAGRVRALLEILCTYQSAFVASSINVEEIIEATEPTATTVEDAPEEVDFG